MKVYVGVLVVCLGIAVVTAKVTKEEENEVVPGGYDNVMTDPCARKLCGPGRECDLNSKGKPICVCISKCPIEEDVRAKVCSTQNFTFASECELYRQKCMCRKKMEGCEDNKFRNGHLDYFGDCKEIPECKEYEMAEYPKRMRTWLFLVMEELASRRDLSAKSMELAERAKQHPKKWVIPVIWKFCDLDMSHDKMISVKELLPISAPLKPLEHCTAPFLESCDEDSNGEISLEEWGKCLELDEEDIEDMCDGL